MSQMQAPHGSVAACADALRPFLCTQTEGGLDAAWVYVAGELDLASVPQLVQTLREAQMQARLVVLDLRELALIDGAGVQAVADASIRARKAGRRLIVLRGSVDIDRLFTLSGHAGVVEIGDLDSAEPALRPGQRLLVSSSLLTTGERRSAR
jgi:anti-anti-sigma factor